ncbi:MAG: flagellar hook-associated protein [Zetaproteobacteria bacterium CG12_big_fil_rev_8_21_14_0_65_55_1124]|nr:MAG: flagellar hook-associated protein [Zetaproteobacteria bacterium CG1_02_55_237]PIS18726.1 MAG: flagellar hook-associated protein [Zetaproteobacteria bacterium CG08_land_8_20_14_0_20_55_17]PIW43958.1 MAG: flagellar hook-associated protein [Zetaproteobacteria bacterium CG12_big_fil_rev_8_21_14_0_65_55_1124]PIY52453.1 MAG: flagellar hook-associated protein [Zetaproteobacteria bacterium CG_4_10_14_0_8_um_filter_55_43]PIZ36732.1 MAG: flagellar hook-associated protein [Zetaproteobacteria bacte
MPGTTNISGLSSGIDWANIVDQLMAVEGRKATLLQNRQQTELDKQSAINSLGSALSSLRSTGIDLADSSKFLLNQSTLSSNSATAPGDLLSVTPDSAATTGSHTIVVTQLAAAEKLGSSSAVKDSTGTAITSDTVALGYTTDSFTIQGKASSAQTVNVASTDSLQAIRDKINQLNTGANATGVTASILKVGTSDYRLILTADNTGTTQGNVLLSGPALDAVGNLANLQMGAVAQGNARQSLQAAADANITVDNIALTRETNTVTDALYGFTLNLAQADPATTITVSTSIDQAGIKAKVQDFVDGYNAIMDFINAQMKFDTNTQTTGILASDSMVRTIQSQLSSSVLQTIPGLAGDRNNMVLAGVSPDSAGHLNIDSATLDNWLATDPTAVRDVFSATATSSNTALQYITYGTGTVSGNYAVNITQAASQASVTGTTDLSLGLGGAETITITDSASRQAVVNLTNAQSLSSIVSALNTEFSQVYTEQRQMNTALTAGGPPATSASTFSALALGVAANDSITISGTKPSGTAVNYTFTVLNPLTDTLADLVSGIQVAFDQKVTASIDSAGKVTITDNKSGDSSLSFTLTANNEGGGTLAFGTEAILTQGRYAMDVSAAASGNFLQLQNNAYGSSSSLTIAQSANNLGIIDQAYSGLDVAGTIGGETATGVGQILTGTAGNVDGLVMMYTASAIGSIGSMSVSMGIGAQLNGLLDTFTNPISGLIQNSVDAAQTNYDSLQTRIDNINMRIEQERARMTASFKSMETLMGRLNSTSSWLTQQTNQFSSLRR